MPAIAVVLMCFAEMFVSDSFSVCEQSTWRFMGSYKRVISRVTIVLTHIRGPITPLITTHEPPSNDRKLVHH